MKIDKHGQNGVKPNYSILARVYDTLMSDVDYEIWADYLDDIIQLHSSGAEKILELACGTGSAALYLDELGYYSITATDGSPQMIEIARKKGKESGSRVHFKTVDFLDIDLDETYDLVFMVFDSINYLHKEVDILKLHKQVRKVLKPGGLFIFDFTTPRNSRQAIRYLHNEEGISPDHFRFSRRSRFDEGVNIHTNEFKIEKLNSERTQVEETFVEVHRQKIYTFNEMKKMIQKTGFRLIECYDGFKFEHATDKSLRITVVSQWQTR